MAADVKRFNVESEFIRNGSAYGLKRRECSDYHHQWTEYHTLKMSYYHNANYHLTLQYDRNTLWPQVSRNMGAVIKGLVSDTKIIDVNDYVRDGCRLLMANDRM